MPECFEPISGFEFSPEEIAETVARKGLLSIEIEFSQKCNFRCPYCYVADGARPEGEMSADEIRNTLREARELGSKKIVILGGEPMIYPRLKEMVAYIRELGMDVELFTNGSNVTPEMARFLLDHRVKVVLKMNTRKPELQDKLSGRAGAHDVIQGAYENLRAAGYPSEDGLMGVSTIICNDNLGELTDFWTWLREEGIEPYFEMVTPQGNAPDNNWLDLPVDTVQAVFGEIARIDRERFGIDWAPQPPLVGTRCLRHQFSCLINAWGDVLPCVGVTIAVGNVRQQSLGDILRDSEVIQDLREYQETIKGPCAACDKAMECYGCRGTAYQLTGDYLASDPTCWRNTARQDEIDILPLSACGFVPHEGTMQIIDRLVSVGERTGVAEMTVPAEGPFVSTEGELDDAVYPEIVAQTLAAMNGFKNRGREGESRGMLLGIKDFKICGSAQSGDKITASVFKSARFGDFGIIESTVTKGDEIVASGEIKIWHQN
jgi:radical SAM protein with 4Fe4S-binding SPASM domain